MKKRLLFLVSIVVILALAFSLVACNNNTNNDTKVEETEKTPDTDKVVELVVPNVDAIALEFSKYNAKLSTVELPEGFSWKNGDDTLKFGTNSYAVTYTKGEQSKDATVSVTIKPSETMVQEDASIAYLEGLLESEAFDKAGTGYASADYDKFVMILARSSKGIKDTIKADYLVRVKDIMTQYIDETTNTIIKPTDSQEEWWTGVNYTNNIVPALLAMGESTTIDGVDIAAPFYTRSYTIGDYPMAYSLVNSLKVARNITIPAKFTTKDGVEHNSDVTAKDIVDALVGTQAEGGGWIAERYAGSQPTGDMCFDVDTATMAIAVLSNYQDDPAVKKAIDKTILDIKANMRESGSIDYYRDDNISGSATTILALSTYGIDANTITKSGSTNSLMTYLASKRLANGGYGYADTDSMSNNDSITALIAYNRMLLGKGAYWDFSK